MESNASAADKTLKPAILAPAGDKNCFLAALAAGADAVYLGLKVFSARMEAENFELAELARLSELAHSKQMAVYVAMNTLLKEEELESAYRLIKCLNQYGIADELIIQDLGMLNLAAQAGFKGGLALSTLANVTSPKALAIAARLGATHVVLPRELSIDEIGEMNSQCPQGLNLECFVHGALCYCVSGRCYWSSYLGGKSGLRGRCVQPCRRVYSKAGKSGEKKANSGERFFSCQDLSLGSLVKTLLSCSNVVAWKIEGRKKGPHYVFHTVTAYRMLRDNPQDSAIRKTALEILDLALGRPGVRARFLPQHKNVPMNPGGQSSSGLFAGKITSKQDGSCYLKPRFELLPRDYLRIGVEDERWHTALPVTRAVPKGGTLLIKLQKHKTPKTGVPVFLIDRRDPQLQKLLQQEQKALDTIPAKKIIEPEGYPSLPQVIKSKQRPDVYLYSSVKAKISGQGLRAVWLSPACAELSCTLLPSTSFWLPPVIWPENESGVIKIIDRLLQGKARHFVCNAPWQRAFFPAKLAPDFDLTAGPFCNIANSLALQELKQAGFTAAFISPELPVKNILNLPLSSPLPLGFVLKGYWPVGISRFGLEGLNVGEFFYSPKGEGFWTRNYGGNIWLYPAWPLDFSEKKEELKKAGYSFFAYIEENPPKNMPVKARPGLFNWNGELA